MKKEMKNWAYYVHVSYFNKQMFVKIALLDFCVLKLSTFRSCQHSNADIHLGGSVKHEIK